MDTSFYTRAGEAPAFDLAGAAQKGLSLRKLMTEMQYQEPLLQQKLASERAAQANTEAATSTALENLAQTKRENEAKVRMNAIVSQYTDPKTGKQDTEAIARDAALAGLDTGTVMNWQQKDAATKQASIKTSADADAYAKSVTDNMENLMRQKPPEEAAAVFGATQKLLTSGIGADRANQYLTQRFGLDKLPPPPEGTSPDEHVKILGQHLVTTAQANAVARSISPQQAIANAQTNESLRQGREGQAQAGVSNVAGPEQRDATSAASRQAQELYLQANPTADRAKVIGMSAADIAHLPGMAQVIQSVIPSAGERAAQVSEATTIGAQKGVIDSGVSAINEDVSKNLGRAGSITRATWNKYVAQDARYAAIQSAIDAHNLANPNAKLDILDGLDAIKRRLSIESTRLGGKVKGAQAAGATPNLAKTAETAGAPTAPQAATVRYRDASGKMYDLPADKADAIAKKNKLVRM